MSQSNEEKMNELRVIAGRLASGLGTPADRDAALVYLLNVHLAIYNK